MLGYSTPNEGNTVKVVMKICYTGSEKMSDIKATQKETR